MTKQAIQHTSTQEANEEDERKRGEEKANLFENCFRSGGEENERQMANNVMRGIRVCDGYLVCLDLMQPPRQWRQKFFLLPLDLALVFPLKRKG